MSKSMYWVRNNGGEMMLYRKRWPNGSEMRHPFWLGYMIETRHCIELGEPVVILTYPDGGTAQFHSIVEAKAAAEKEAGK